MGIPSQTVAIPADQLKVSILDSLWQLESRNRKEEREGLAGLVAALSQAAPIDARRYQALGRSRLADLAAAQARDIAFRGNKRKKAKRLETRAALVQVATDELITMVHLEVPGPTLETFLVVGTAYVDFGQAMLDESRVRGLSDDQRSIYEAERTSRVEGVWVNATRYFDRGLQYAERVGWAGPEVEDLRVAMTAVVQRTEALADK